MALLFFYYKFILAKYVPAIKKKRSIWTNRRTYLTVPKSLETFFF